MTMAVAMRPAPFEMPVGSSGIADFVRWLRTHPTAIVVAYLLGFAYPLTSLASALGVVPELSASAGGLRPFQDHGPGCDERTGRS